MFIKVKSSFLSNSNKNKFKGILTEYCLCQDPFNKRTVR